MSVYVREIITYIVLSRVLQYILEHVSISINFCCSFEWKKSEKKKHIHVLYLYKYKCNNVCFYSCKSVFFLICFYSYICILFSPTLDILVVVHFVYCYFWVIFTLSCTMASGQSKATTTYVYIKMNNNSSNNNSEK